MFTTPYTVPFGDVDHARILYYPRYFHVFHRAFESWWDSVGRPYHVVIGKDKVGFPSVHIESDFTRPTVFGAPMEVRVGVKRIGECSVVFRYELAHKETGELHASADITKAIVDMETFRPMRPPSHIREALEQIRQV